MIVLCRMTAICSLVVECAPPKPGKNGSRGIRSLSAALFGRSRHLWMWDYKAIQKELAEAGFVEIRRAEFGDASDPNFREVEDEGRWVDCLGVDCRRP